MATGWLDGLDCPDLGSQLQDGLLTCNICLEEYDQPKCLPCQHTFCARCLENYVGQRRMFPCPVCRENTVLPSNGIVGLRSNFTLLKLKDELLSHNGKKSDWYCGEHNTNVASSWCSTCQIPLCSECTVGIITQTSEHRHHDIKSVKDALKSKADLMDYRVKEDEESITKLDHLLEALNEKKDYLSSEKCRLENQLKTRFATLRGAIDRWHELCKHNLTIMYGAEAGKVESVKTDIMSSKLHLVDNISCRKETMKSATEGDIRALVHDSRDEVATRSVILEHRVDMIGTSEKFRLTETKLASKNPADNLFSDDHLEYLFGKVVMTSLESKPTPEIDDTAFCTSMATVAETETAMKQVKTLSAEEKPMKQVKTLSVEEKHSSTLWSRSDGCLQYGFAIGGTGEYFLTKSLMKVFSVGVLHSETFVFDTCGNLVRCLRQGHGGMEGVCDVATFPDGHVLLNFQNNMKVFDREWNVILSISKPKSCSRVVVLSDDKIVFLDSGSRKVHIYSLSRMAVLQTLPTEVRLNYENTIITPHNIAVNNLTHDIIVSDVSMKCIYAFTQSGQHRFTYGSKRSASEDVKLIDPSGGMCTDSEGRIYIGDNGGEQIHVLSKDGELVCSFPFQSLSECLHRTVHLAIDTEEHLVTVTWDGTIHVFDCKIE